MVVSTLEQWILKMFQETPIHILVEVSLIIFLFILLFRDPEPAKKMVELSLEEEESIISDWKPPPIVPDIEKDDFSKLSAREVTKGPCDTIEIDGRTMINFGTPNFLGLLMNKEVIDASIEAVNKYSVSSGGPRNFYGTFDCHCEFEKRIAEFFGLEDSVCYPFHSTAATSVLQSLIRNTDIVFIDDSSIFCLHLGVIITHCRVVEFKHNDISDLRSKLQYHRANYERWQKCNRWVITEGLFESDGQILDLPNLIKLRKEFCLRIILDESLSLGCLGQTGRGLCEHFGIDRKSNIEITIGSCSPSFASSVGFIVCDKKLSDFHRLASHSYTSGFSPTPFSIVAAIKSLEIAQKEGSQRIKKLRENIKYARKELLSNDGIKNFKVIPNETISSSEEFDLNNLPIIHLQLLKPKKIEVEDKLLQTLCDACMDDTEFPVAVVKSKYVRTHDLYAPRPSVKIYISPAHSFEQIKHGMETIRRCAISIFS